MADTDRPHPLTIAAVFMVVALVGFFVWLLNEYPPRGSSRREPPGRAEFEADRHRICTASGRAAIDRSEIVARIEHFGPGQIDVFVTHAWKSATLDFRKGFAVYVSTCETNRRSRVAIFDTYTGNELATYRSDGGYVSRE